MWVLLGRPMDSWPHRRHWQNQAKSKQVRAPTAEQAPREELAHLEGKAPSAAEAHPEKGSLPSWARSVRRVNRRESSCNVTPLASKYKLLSMSIGIHQEESQSKSRTTKQNLNQWQSLSLSRRRMKMLRSKKRTVQSSHLTENWEDRCRSINLENQQTLDLAQCHLA